MLRTGTLHVVFAIAALACGVVVAFSRKGTVWHWRWGWGYAASMIALNVTALMTRNLTGAFGPFHLAALFSLFTLAMGLVPARRRRRGWMRTHGYWMAGSYVGLWAALAAEATTRIEGLPFWATAGWTSVAVFTVGVALVLRRVPSAVRNVGSRRP